MAKDEPKIVAATGTAAGSLKGADIEAAMVKAIEQAAADGVTDPEEIRWRILEARDRVTGKAPS